MDNPKEYLGTNMAENRKGGPVLIGKINRSKRERLMVTLDEVKGTKIIDCRVYNIIEDGELKPTNAGVSFGLDHVGPLIDLLKEAQEKARG